MIKVCYHFKVKKCLVVLLDLTNTRCAQMCDDDEQCNALPTKIAIFQTITHHRTPPIFSTFSIPKYIHTQPAFLSHSIIEVVLKVHSRQFITSIISIISDLFTTGSQRHHFHPLLPSTLQPLKINLKDRTFCPNPNSSITLTISFPTMIPECLPVVCMNAMRWLARLHL